MAYAKQDMVNWATFGQFRAELGADFIRILSYFREDGVKCLVAIEQAQRALDAVAMVAPAQTLKEDSMQFGALALSLLAEKIEMDARYCVECHDTPEELLEDIVALRPLFEATINQLDRETNPLQPRRATAATFRRRPDDESSVAVG